MKRIVITLLAIAAMTFSMNAQTDVKFSEDADLAYGNEFFFVEPVSYIGYGVHLPNTEMATEMSLFNNEFFVNVMELGLRPSKCTMFAIGVDYKLDQYRLNKYSLWGAESGNSVWIRSLISTPYQEVAYSRLNVHTLSIPLSFECQFGKCSFRVGAAGEYNLPAVNKDKLISNDGSKVKNKVTGIPVKEFNYSLFGAVNYGGLGLYVRYRPMYQFNDGLGPQFKSLSVGAVIGLGM